MKGLIVQCFISLSVFLSVSEAIFLGPIAVGVALGALAVKKGLILGSILSSGRTNHNTGRSYSGYSRYNRNNHYTQTTKYYTYYTKPKPVSAGCLL